MFGEQMHCTGMSRSSWNPNKKVVLETFYQTEIDKKIYHLSKDKELSVFAAFKGKRRIAKFNYTDLF